MEILFKNETLIELKKAGVKSPVFLDEEITGWRDIQIDTKYIQAEDFPIIKEVIKKEKLWARIENRRIMKKIEIVESLEGKDPKGLKVKTLEVLAESIRRTILKVAPRRWVFCVDAQYGSLVPYFVDRVTYHPPERSRGGDYTPAFVTMNLSASRRGSKVETVVQFKSENIGRTVEEILKTLEIYIENEKLVADYEAELEKYRKEAPLTGEQYLARGTGQAVEDEDREASKWHRDEVSMEREGVASKVVMDDQLGQGKNDGMASLRYWSGKHVGEDAPEDDSEKMIKLPTHPVVRVFSLSIHGYVDIHISNVSPYQYDATLIDKLVLPKNHQELVEILTHGAANRMSDIVKGKAQGIIVLSSGKPGTGKTLTAEVYSEVIRRPLYTVQCSQLGTDEETLEELLSEVLDRATRWKALLLIDEADVYIHERGSDIQQNAIVGVFLRLLEYYRGILFLTTNRETVIDDAIVSRVTAHVKYTLPEASDMARLWKILLTQYGIKPTDTLVASLMNAFKKISGRSIRQLIRLGKMIADHQKKPFSTSHAQAAAQFHDFTELE